MSMTTAPIANNRLVPVTSIIILMAVFAAYPIPGNAQENRTDGYTAAEPVMRRLTAEQYRNVIADVFGIDIEIGGRLEPDLREQGLYSVGASHVSVTGTGMEQYDQMARTIASQVLDTGHRGVSMPCRPTDALAPDDDCAGRFLANTGLFLFRRPLTDGQIDVYITAAREAALITGDFYEGLSLSLAAMLSAPQFLFRLQRAEPDPENPGRYRLDDWSRAAQLSFFLWNSTPDKLLLESARKGELNSAPGLQKQVRRMMSSPRIEQGLRAFFIDNYRFRDFETLTKDARLFPKFSAEVAADAREQTLRTIVELLWRENGDYRELFTTRRTFLTPGLGAIYQVPVPKTGPNGSPDDWQPYEFGPSDPQIGILTHISFTGLHSPPGRGSPTIRGKAMREVMLCQIVPAPPADVPFDIVQDMTNPLYKTARKRLTAHRREPACAGCHNIMDPIGLALENFDGAGEYRSRENGEVIDPSGEFDSFPFKDLGELSELIANSGALTSCLVNRLMAYAAGREIGYDEKPWVKQVETVFAEGGYRLPHLMNYIATSEDFYRVAEPESAEMALKAEQSDAEVEKVRSQPGVSP